MVVCQVSPSFKDCCLRLYNALCACSILLWKFRRASSFNNVHGCDDFLKKIKFQMFVNGKKSKQQTHNEICHLRMVLSKRQTNDVEKMGLSYTIGGNVNLYSQLWKTVWRFLKKLKIGVAQVVRRPA
jgi:hypothetical protein